jgi:PadR family transcriptional regulator PadR
MAWNSSDFRSPFGKITDITIRRFLFAFFGDFVPHHTRVPTWRFLHSGQCKIFRLDNRGLPSDYSRFGTRPTDASESQLRLPGRDPHRHPDLHILTIMMRGRYGLAMTFSGLSSDETNTDVIQGTLDMLILKTLSLEPMHGFGIARRVEQISRGVFKVNPGSLLTALQRLERAGWLDAEWQQTENSRRAKYYRLTRAGKKQLEIESADWKRRASAIARLLNAEG